MDSSINTNKNKIIWKEKSLSQEMRAEYTEEKK